MTHRPAIAFVAPAAVLALGVSFGLAGAPRADVVGRSPAELLRAVAARHASVETLQARFRQEYRSAAIGRGVTETGRIWVKRPLMRWDYEEPDRKVFLVEEDGSTLSYVPADRTAVRGRLPEDAPHVQLLLGRGDLDESFAVADVELKEPVVPGSRQLRLVPRRPMAGVASAYLEIDEAELSVLRVLVVDELDNESDLVLLDQRVGERIRDRVFDARLPAGVTVRGDVPDPAGRAGESR